LKGFVDDWESEERTESKLAVAYFNENITILAWRN
jgi:hypothetical protein